MRNVPAKDPIRKKIEAYSSTLPLKGEANLKTIMPEECLGINIFEDRFLYYSDYGVIAFPDIYARFYIEKKKDIYQLHHERGWLGWVIRGINHEFLHRIIHKEVGLEACEKLDNLDGEGLW